MAIILFDLDGTLIDSRADLVDSMNLARAQNGLKPLQFDYLVSCLGCGIVNYTKGGFPEYSDNADKITSVMEQYREIYNNHLVVKTKLFPGVPETLRQLSRTHKLAVVSNKPDDASHQILEKLGVFQYFSSIIGGGRCSSLKPSPEGIFLAAAECGSTLEDAWMVGDHWTDMQAAANAKIHACFCAYGFGNQKQQRSDAVINDFRMLLNVILST